MYDAAFFDMIRPGCQASAAAVVPVVLNHIQPRTVIDVGCGEGWWAKAFADLGGCEVLGLDGPGAGGALDGRFVAWDLRYSFADVARGELAVSLEVAEHLSAKRADGFVNDLCSIADVVLFSAAIPGQGGVGHCFPGDTVVSGPAARRSFARCYEGPLTELRFASGEFLAATPNHPILAAQGWVAAGLLKEGDYVVRCRDSEGITAMVPGKYQVPALIHDVAAAIGVAGNVMLRSVPVAAEDFHGDGVGSQVAVVRTDSQLRHRGDASLTQPARELTLTSARMGPSLLSRDGAPALRLKAPLHALHPANQRRGDALLSSRTSPRRGDAVHFGSTPHGHPGRRQPVSDQVPGYAELRSKSAGAGAGLIQFDQVSSVGFGRFAKTSTTFPRRRGGTWRMVSSYTTATNSGPATGLKSSGRTATPCRAPSAGKYGMTTVSRTGIRRICWSRRGGRKRIPPSSIPPSPNRGRWCIPSSTPPAPTS